MLPRYRIWRKFALRITLFALTLLACALTDVVPEPCTDMWLITKLNVANANPDADTIDLDPGCTYEFDEIDNTDPYNWGNALPTITTPIVIHGNGATIRRSAAAGTPGFRFFFVESGGSLTLDDMTITNGGYVECTGCEFPGNQGSKGGAIRNHGTLTIADSIFTNNQAKLWGGAILNHGTLTIANSIFTNNQAKLWGGAIQTEGIANITLSEFTGNQATMTGGVIASDAELTITSSTFSDNQSEDYGGGVIVNNGEITITDSTFSNNLAEWAGDVIDNREGGEITITGSTFSNNLAGGVIYNAGQLIILNSTLSGNQTDCPDENRCGAAIFNTGSNASAGINHSTLVNNTSPSAGAALFTEGGHIVISNSIVAENSGSDCGSSGGGSITSNASSLDSDGTCMASITAPPLLDPLDDNGGLTQTHALQPSSPARDAATGACPPPATDQRGEPRLHGPACDLGAYEFSGGGPPPPAPMLPTPTVTSSLSWIGTVPAEILCYQGPDPAFGVVSSLQADSTVNLVGVSEQGSHVVLDNPRYPGVNCYVRTDQITIDEEILAQLPTLPDPSLPTPTATIAVPPTATVTPLPPATGSISGVVFKDNNQNGSQQVGEAGISGVTVHLGQGACASSGYQNKATDGNGRFNFTNLTAGTYCLSVNLPGGCVGYFPTTPTEYTIKLKPGENVIKLFGGANMVC